ncbi:hypothetical protein C8Q75DRAFT_739552 [Abortiporus biennis]|nr:hypothetical protein C8Q75DRAFT_739552 [Abortiporus biennis]
MHRLNISLSCFGPRAGQAIIFCLFILLTLTLVYLSLYWVLANIPVTTSIIKIHLAT